MPPPHDGTPQYEKPAPMTADQKALIEKENRYRQLFAEDPNNPELNEAHLLLENVFEHEDEYVFQDETEEEKAVPKLLTQCRKLGLRGKAIVSRNEFLSRWSTFTNGVLAGLDWRNVFCAGGAILGNLIADNAGYSSSDIDLFLYGLDSDEAANAKLREIHALVCKNTGGRGDVIRTARAVTILNNAPFRHVQVVLRVYKTPAEVLLGFDIDSCTVGFDGTDIYCMERFKRALTKRYNLVNTSRRSLTYEQRLYKYSRRGFAVAVPNLDKSRVNPAIFTKSIKELFGLSKLLLYDHLAQRSVQMLRSQQQSSTKPLWQIQGQESSDYNGDLEIPWGPNFSTQRILQMLKLKDSRQFFGRLAQMKKAARNGGGFNSSAQQPQKKVEHLFEKIFFDSVGSDGAKQPKIEWIRNNPAYQDLDGGFTRPLMTGSFQLPPAVQAVWDLESYSTNATNVSGLSSDQGYVPGTESTTTPTTTSTFLNAPAAFAPPKKAAIFEKLKKKHAMLKVKKASKKAAESDESSSGSDSDDQKEPPRKWGYTSAKVKPMAAKIGSGGGGFITQSPDTMTTGGGIFHSGPVDLSAFGGPRGGPGVIASPGGIGPAGWPASQPAMSQPSSSGVNFSPTRFSVLGNNNGNNNNNKRDTTPEKKPKKKLPPNHTQEPPLPPSFPSTFPAMLPPPGLHPALKQGAPMPMLGGNMSVDILRELITSAVQSAVASTSSLKPPTGTEEAPPTTKLLLLISLCFKQGSLSIEEKATLKDLVIARNEAVFAALEVFEVDQDLEELVDTWKRTVKAKQA